MDILKKICYVSIGIIILLFVFLNKYDAKVSYNKGDRIVVDVDKETIIETEFTVKHDNLSYIGIQFATYGKKNLEGKISVVLKEKDNGRTVCSQTINLNQIGDNFYFPIYLEKVQNSKNKDYIMTITTLKLKEGNEFGIWGFVNDDKYVLINGKKESIDLSYIYGYRRNDLKKLLYFVLYITIISFIEVFKGDNQNEFNK